MKQGIKYTYHTLIGGLIIMGMAAKVKKDFATHKQHEEHNPCKCGEQCIRCLFT